MKIIPFVEVGSDPSAVADNVVLYAKDSSGITKLYMRRSDGDIAEVSAAGIRKDFFGPDLDGTVVFDGAATILGMVPVANVYTMVRDIGVVNLTIDVGVTLKPAGFRVSATGTVTINGIYDAKGNVGLPPSGGVAGVGGAVLPDGSVNAGSGGGAGGGATATSGGAVIGVMSWWTASSVNLAGNGSGTGDPGDPGDVPGRGGGGGGSNGTGGQGGSGGTIAAASVGSGLSNMRAIWRGLPDIHAASNGVAYGTRYEAGSGGGGSALAGGAGGGSGGSWASISAPTITGTGTITANGGAGGAGGSVTTTGCGGGGGGGGGIVCLIYNTRAGSLTVTSTGGAGGVAGTGSGGAVGGVGGNGANGSTFLFNLSGDGT
jgi:hypothetical protein